MIALAFLAIAAAEPLTIERAIELALERNEIGRAADARAAAADARVSRAWSFFLPDLTLAGTYIRRPDTIERQNGDETITIQSENALNGIAALRLTLFDLRGFPLLDAAQLERDAAELSAADVRQQLAYSAAGSFLTLLGTEQVLSAAKSRVALARQSLNDAEGRASAGLVSSNDATRARLELASAERDLTAAEQEAATARLELAFVIDTPVDALAEPANLLEQASSAPAGLDPDATKRRLDVRAAAKRAEALDAFANEPWSRALPRFDIVGQYRITNESGFTGTTSNYFGGIEATWLLWDGGERSAESDERHALATAGHLDATALARQTETDVRRALVVLEKGRDAALQAAAAVEVARRNSAESMALYRQGLTTALSVADANLRLFEAEVELARARYGVGVAFLGLRAARGMDPLGREPS